MPCAKDLKASGEKSLVMAGYRLPAAAQMLVLAMNEALGAVRIRRLSFMKFPKPARRTLRLLAEAIHADKVPTLVILGGNPAYNAPADLNLVEARRKASAENGRAARILRR